MRERKGVTYRMRDKANGKGVEKRGYEQEKSGELKYVQVKEGKGKIYIYI